MKTKLNLFDKLMMAVTFAEADVDLYEDTRKAAVRKHDKTGTTTPNRLLVKKTNEVSAAAR